MLPFFSIVHWGRIAFLVVLAAVLLATAGRAVWLLAQPIAGVTGVIEAIEEERVSNRAATYTLWLRTDEGGLAFIRLRNNGRILSYLLEQDDPTGSRVFLRHRQGLAVELAFPDGTTPLIRESAASPLVSFLILLPGLLLLFLLGRPDLVERRPNPQQIETNS